LHLLSFLSLFNADVVVALVECCVVVFEDYSKVHGQQQTIKISRNVVASNDNNRGKGGKHFR